MHLHLLHHVGFILDQFIDYKLDPITEGLKLLGVNLLLPIYPLNFILNVLLISVNRHVDVLELLEGSSDILLQFLVGPVDIIKLLVASL